MQPRTLNAAPVDARLVLTCEHASAAVPDEYARLGLRADQLEEHIGWDIGAAALTEALSAALGAPAVLSGVSRLLVDCNRDLHDADLIPHASHGVVIPGNAAVTPGERTARLDRFYRPYHDMIGTILEGRPRVVLLSIHSFTPELNGAVRPFDVGVLHDDYADLATGLAADLTAKGFAVRMNEPYSALDGLIFSARSHGRHHGVPYLELEINNRLLRDASGVRDVAGRVVDAVARLADTVGS